MGTRSPHFEAGKKSLLVKRRNKTCLVTCHFNENISLSQLRVSLRLPFLLVHMQGRKPQSSLGSFRERGDSGTNISGKVS